jgi:ADP-heptose:LPS heptosyltransferase
MKILLVKPSSFGDVIHAMPVAAALRRHPGVIALDWVVAEAFAPLVRECQDVRRTIEFPRKNPARLFRFLRELREEHYDWVVDLQGLLRSSLMARWAWAEERWGMSDAREGACFFYDKIAQVTPGHAIDRYEQVLRAMGVAVGTRQFSLPSTEGITFEGLPEKFILLHPFSRWPTKQIPAPWLAELVRALAPMPCVLAGQGRYPEIPGLVNFSNRTSFRGLLALIRRATAVVSSDSGPMHLAAAAGRPLVAVFGPTSPEKTGPWTPESRVVRAHGLPCMPCHRRECSFEEPMACMSRVEVKEVIAALESAMSPHGGSGS